ncbi:MAG: SDR family oxidoreductase [Stagnimonas sp.]|nr:SDR family oxidoreductase [Stagnimonas sp.]
MTQTVLITGASAGIGQQLALAFARRGYNLALAARRLESLVTLKEQLLLSHPQVRVEIAALDVNQLDSVAPVINGFAAAFGSLDIVVANAGVGDGGGLVGTGGFARDAAVIQTNVLGAMATIDAAVAIFRKQKQGHVVAISSVAASRGVPGAAAYCTSKAAIAMYADAVRAELHSKPIKVTTLFPGYIDTEMNNRMKRRPFLVTVENGAERIAKLIERGVQQSAVPGWPWGFVMWLLRKLPISIIAKQAPFAD